MHYTMLLLPSVCFIFCAVIYKDGPGHFHASYVVLTKVIFGQNSIETGELSEKKMDWITLMGLNRLAETSGKVRFCF